VARLDSMPEDPRDLMIPRLAPAQAPAPAAPATAEFTPVMLPSSLVQECRDAVGFLARETPDLTVERIVEVAVWERLARLWADHNGGEPFPRTG